MTMYIDSTKINEITFGAAEVLDFNGEFSFMRFTPEQRKSYKEFGNEDFYMKTFATAGVNQSFLTNSEYLKFSYSFFQGSSRDFGFFDIYVNDILFCHTGTDGQESNGSVNLELPKGEKKICIYFPWSKKTITYGYELSDSAYVKPVKKRIKMICFGDSITQGYDCTYPSLSYASVLATELCADCRNKGIGAEMFNSKILENAEDFDADIITVAYGTNDWSTGEYFDRQEECRKFMKIISERYPLAKIFYISPIRRLDYHENVRFGKPHSEYINMVKEQVNGLENVTVIDGYELTPQIKGFYSDGVHPNDLGFGIMSKNLLFKRNFFKI